MVSVDEARRQVEKLRQEIASLKMDYHTLREVETLINRTLTILERSTGSKEIKQAINNLQRLISVIRMAQYSIHTFQLATGPIGWALAISGFAMTGVIAVSNFSYANEVRGH